MRNCDRLSHPQPKPVNVKLLYLAVQGGTTLGRYIFGPMRLPGFDTWLISLILRILKTGKNPENRLFNKTARRKPLPNQQAEYYFFDKIKTP